MTSTSTSPWIAAEQHRAARIATAERSRLAKQAKGARSHFRSGSRRATP